MWTLVHSPLSELASPTLSCHSPLSSAVSFPSFSQMMIDPPPRKCDGDGDGHRRGFVAVADGSSVRTTLSNFSKVSPQPLISPTSMAMELARELHPQKPLLPADNGAPPSPAAGSHQGVAAVELRAQPAPMNGNRIVQHPTLCRCGLAKQETKRYFNVDCSQFKHGKNQVALLKGKEISGADSLCDCAPLTVTAQNGEVHKAGWAKHGTSDAKSLTQEAREDLRNVTSSKFKQATYFVENKGSLIKGKGTSGPDSLCDCVPLMKTAGNEHNATGPAMQLNDSYLTQFFVKVDKKVLSMQKNLNTTTVKELIEYACCKAGIQACDVYATYGGKPLKHDKFIAWYPIFRDSTIHIRFRSRAGSWKDDLQCETFEELMSQNMNKRFHTVLLSQLTTNAVHQKGTAKFLSRFSGYYIHKILVFVCGKHREKKSFNGEFDASKILIVNGTMVQFDSSVREYNFKFYLFLCPAKDKSNSEPLIQFLTNHPALTSFADRIKQCIILDSMVHRLDPKTDRADLDTAVGSFASWTGDVQNTPALKTVYLYNSHFNPATNVTTVNSEYTTQGLGCVHFSKNYFIHADYQVHLEEAEAAFAQTLEEFLPETLLRMAKGYTTAPAGFDILTLLGNSLADPFTGK